MGLKKELQIPEELYNMANEEYEKGWHSDKVVIKRFLYGDSLAIQQASMKVKAQLGSQAIADFNISEIQTATILRGVVQAPWGINNISTVRELPPFIGEWVYEQINEFNTLSAKKKEVSKTSLEDSQTETKK